jgi:DNA (cytosine-5)-methyltransferase 1
MTGPTNPGREGREPFRLLDLFSGVGGFSLGLERTGGFKTVAFSEVAPHACRVLARHWPGMPNLGDVSRTEFPDADVISAGFPCQDLSYAGLGAGMSGNRSGLWSEVVRAIRVVRPLYVLLENVGALLGRGMGKVLGDMAALGYDAEWHCIPSSALGSPDRRDRAWIVGQPASNAPLLLGEAQFRREQDRAVSGHWRDGWRATAEKLRHLDDGVPGRVDGLTALANAVKPQFPELIGNAILAAHTRPSEAA